MSNFFNVQQLKNEALEAKDKTKILLKHSENVKIKSREIEVMPLPPANYAHLKVKEIQLKESMELIQEREKNLKDLRLKNAIEKLGLDAKSTSSDDQKVKLEKYNGENYMEYREREETEVDSDDDDNEKDAIDDDSEEENEDDQE